MLAVRGSLSERVGRGGAGAQHFFETAGFLKVFENESVQAHVVRAEVVACLRLYPTMLLNLFNCPTVAYSGVVPTARSRPPT